MPFFWCFQWVPEVSDAEQSWKRRFNIAKVRTSTTILRRGPSSSWSNSTSKQARDLVFFLNHRFLAMANHLGPFPEASDGPEGQEQPVWAVGGQKELREVTHLPSLCFLS